MINKMAYYHNIKMYVLEINKLSRKNEIAFYDLDERLPKLESNYILTISKNKIISITTFDNEKINLIVKEMSE
jgi:3-dehydroquinate dehydratase